MKKNKSKLEWKEKWNDDKSGYWYSAKVPIIGWEYIIDVYEHPEEFTASVFYSKYSDDVTMITSKNYRKKESAMNACEKHLDDMVKKFLKWKGK